MELTINHQRIRQAFLSGRIKAICGYPGIGKTYLTNQDSRFVDGWLSEHLYIDKAKGIRNPDFPSNYMRTVSNIIKQGKIVVTAMSEEARDVFNMLDMPFVVIYPNASEKDRYFNIYDARPDVREWISLNKRVWDDKIKRIQEMRVPIGCYKDEIPKGMNLTEYLTQLGVLSLVKVPEYAYIETTQSYQEQIIQL